MTTETEDGKALLSTRSRFALLTYPYGSKWKNKWVATERPQSAKKAYPWKSIGVLFILATVSAMLVLLFFYLPILAGPDYLINGAAHTNQVVVGALMELVLVCTAIGLFPVRRPYSECIALGHLFFRFLEVVVITVGITALLSLLTLSPDFVAAAAPNTSAYHASGTLLLAVYKWTSVLGPLFFLGISMLMYSYLL